jgi:4-amino-4-deoxychorismate lyase
LLFNSGDNVDLEAIISVPDEFRTGVVKCRIAYAREIEQIEFIPYMKPAISKLRLVISDEITYDHKMSDRSALAALFSKRGDADDILIVKHGMITDTSIANVAFFDGSRWLTPARPLLCGTKRQKLIDENAIAEADIRVPDLQHFERASCINAMLDLDEVSLPVSAIVS